MRRLLLLALLLPLAALSAAPQLSSDVGLRTSDGLQRTSDPGHRTSDVLQRTPDVGPRTSDVTSRISHPFAAGWLLTDTNADGLADAIHGHIVVPDQPSAAENAAAADVAARLAYGSTGLTLPVVVAAGSSEIAGGHVSPPLQQQEDVGAAHRGGPSDIDSGPHIWIGARAVPAARARDLTPLTSRLAVGEGGVFTLGDDLVIVGKDEAGLLAAAEGYASHAPYQWKTPGDMLAKIAGDVNAAFEAHKVSATATLAGVTYESGKEGIRRALLRIGAGAPGGHGGPPLRKSKSATGDVGGHVSPPLRESGSVGAGLRAGPTAIRTALSSLHLDQVRELVLLPARGPAITIQTNREPLGPVHPTPGGTDRHRLDLATLYTINGLFGGSAKMPVPASLDGRLYVPAGEAGIAMANLAARMGLESTGITIPLAFPAAGESADKLTTQAVIAGNSPLADAIARRLDEEVPGWSTRAPLQPGEGLVRIVDDALGTQVKNQDAPTRKDVILVRGDAAGSAAAVDLIAGHFPNLWEVGKPYLSLEEIRYDLHRFFSLRSAAGQASVALYHLDRWMNEIAPVGQPAPAVSPVSDVQAEIDVDKAYPGLDAFVQHAIEQRLHVTGVTVKTGSLHAGMQCCAENPPLHYEGPGYPFHQGPPTFSEDITIPWEGTTLLNDVRAALGGHASPPLRESNAGGPPLRESGSLGAGLRAGPVVLEARVSEGPDERAKLATELTSILTAAGADPARTEVHVLSAYKQGYSWLMDEIVPALKGKPVARLTIACAPNVDAKGMSAVNSRARWIQELYPVDEMIAKALNIPLDKIAISEMPAPKPSETDPTYVVQAFDASGQELLHRDFTETTAEAPYNGTYQHYDYVKVETGWVHLSVGSKVVLDKRIETDPEVFWTHYQTKTLPRVFEYVMAQAKGRPEAEYQPMFDTIRLDIHMSEPDYNIGLDKERISMLEALQEDTFYSTENFFYMIGDLEMGQHWDYPGRIIPIVHPSEDGRDGRVHIDFYAKPAANPVVRLSWSDAQGHRHTEERDLPALRDQPDPRLIEARAKAGAPGVESLTWSLPADSVKDDYRDWLKVVAKDSVEHTMFSVEQAQGQIHWLEALHQAGLYPDDLAYPNLGQLGMELVLPVDRADPTGAASQRVFAEWDVPAPKTKRPMIADYLERAATPGGPYVEQKRAGGDTSATGAAAGLRTGAADPSRVGAGLRTGAADPSRVGAGLRAGAADSSRVGAGLRAGPNGQPPIVQWDQPIDPAGNAQILARLATYPGVTAYWMGRSYLGLNIWAADVMLPSPSKLRSWAKETTLKAAVVYSGRQHANEVSSTSHIDKLGEQLVTDPATRAMLKQVNVVLHPITNPDGAQLSIDLYHVTPDNLLHPGYHGSLTSDVVAGQWEHDPIYPESRTRRQLFEAWLPDAFLNPHGYPSHEWVQPFSGYTGWVISRMGAHSGREWWLPRGWFTSLYYLRDEAHPYSEQFTYDLRNRIADAISHVPGLMPLENRMNARYQRWGQRWDPDYMMQPIVGGVRIYMSLKGTTPSSGNSAFMRRFPDVTYDDGYTEAPDETAYGPYLHLLASAGLAFDRVHLKYLAEGELRIHRTEKAAGSGVTWSVSRERPILPTKRQRLSRGAGG